MNEKRLPASLVHSYGLATMGFNLMMMVAINYYTYFLTDVVMIAAIHLAIFMPLTHVIDAVSIPIGGAIIQKTQFRWGQFRSWLLFLPVSTFIFFTITFTNIPSASYGVKLLYLGMAYIISHISLNFAFNAHLGLISVLSGHIDDRASLSTWNTRYTYGAQFIFAIAAIPVLEFCWDMYGESRGFFLVVLVLAGVQVLGYWNLFARTKEYDRYDPDKMLKPAHNLTIVEMVKQLFGNRHLLLIMIADTLKDVAIFGLVSIAVYYFKYVTGDTSWMRTYTISSSISIITATVLAPYVIKKIGRKNTCIYSAFLGIFGYLILHKFGTNGPLTYTLIIACTNLVVYLPMPIRQAMYMDACEYGFYKTGKNASAFIMSMYTMPVKIGIAGALAIIPLFLAYIGYVPNMESTPEFVSNLMNLVAFLPIACYLMAGFIFIFYGLTEERLAFYMEENAKKRAETGA
jgi:GPH family glycoside/pentoside/hexuronide:cation symporter